MRKDNFLAPLLAMTSSIGGEIQVPGKKAACVVFLACVKASVRCAGEGSWRDWDSHCE